MMSILAVPRARHRGGGAELRPPPPPDNLLPAFERSLDAFGPEIYRYLRRFAGSAEDAADLHQETFLRAFRAYGRLRPDANVRAWLYRIAANVATDEHRRRARRGTAEASLPPEQAIGGPGPEAVVRSAELASAVRAALLELSPRQRAAVVARVFDGLGYDQVSDLLACSEAAARQHVSQGLRRLRVALEEWR